ncbi:hypothetical protein IEQ34_016087 [Dendrobium chrysotoxum]|uniref:Uncharacterized protein n=1 Tax=Dendrobium chrysotoxum TaxID=161865 RepID=A0AAV7GEM4_DENCH|nr:hypothetical protein IEQ34_016087 [Dendrobium chrysotoxum]
MVLTAIVFRRNMNSPVCVAIVLNFHVIDVLSLDDVEVDVDTKDDALVIFSIELIVDHQVEAKLKERDVYDTESEFLVEGLIELNKISRISLGGFPSGKALGTTKDLMTSLRLISLKGVY